MDNYEYIHEDNLANIPISDDVIAVCAINATLKTGGVVELVGGFTDTISENLLKKETISKGVKVNQVNKGVILEVFVVIMYGANIPQVAWDIQENIKREVENITEKKVKAINIHVQGVKKVEEKIYE